MGNEAHGTMHGVRTKATSTHQYGQECVAFNNFLIWKAYDYGFYLTTMDNMELKVLSMSIICHLHSWMSSIDEGSPSMDDIHR